MQLYAFVECYYVCSGTTDLNFGTSKNTKILPCFRLETHPDVLLRNILDVLRQRLSAWSDNGLAESFPGFIKHEGLRHLIKLQATNMVTKFVGFVAAASSIALLGEAFSPSLPSRHSSCIPSSCQTVVRPQTSELWSTAGGTGGGKKKRRRRKQPVTDPSSSTEVNSPESASSVDESLEEIEFDTDDEPIDISLIKDVAKFKFEGEISAPGMLDYL